MKKKFFNGLKVAKNIWIYTLVPVVAIVAILYLGGWLSFGGSNEINNDTLKEKLTRVGELTVAKYEVESEETFEDYRELPVVNCNIPGTRNTMTIKYTGNVEFWYDLKTIQPVINGKNINIKIPEKPEFEKKMHVKDTEVIQDNNLLNPIDANDVAVHNKELENKLLERAEKKGIYDAANEQLHKVVYNLYKDLDGHDGYKVNIVA